MPEDASANHELDSLLDGIDAAEFDSDDEASQENVTSPFKPVVTGFVTGRNRVIAPPSVAAIERAKKLFLEEEKEEKEEEGSEGPSLKKLRLDAPRSSGFATASGAEAPALSDQARAAGMGFFGASNSPPSDPSKSATASFSTPRSAPGLFTAPGSLRAGATSSPITPMGFTVPVSTPSRPSTLSTADTALPLSFSTPRTPAPARSGFATASGSPAPPISQAARSAVLSEGFATAGGKQVAGPSKAAMERARALFQDDWGESTPVKTPLRTPLGFTPSNVATKIATAVRGKPISIKTPARRVGLAATPQSRKKTGFATPFKQNRPAPPRAPPPLVTLPVFDCTPYLKPQYFTTDELRERAIPEEIWLVNSNNAQFYHFELDEGDLGVEEATKRLGELGCKLSTLKWVTNHWGMILWKLAGTIQAQPDMMDSLWQWDVVINQLLYRYEREFGLAQRPIVRRIQEHDSAPSLAMVLYIDSVHQPAAEGLPYLVLCDGWYRIKAQLDPCLARVIKKLVPGRKLAISGAKLESGADGAEALDAFETSRLVLTGNGTSLARWDAKLGVQGRPFVAGLSSLSVDGGIIPIMDLVVEKVFPLAFANNDRAVIEAPWGEAEERTRQDQWKDKYEAETNRLAAEFSKSISNVQNIVEMLAQASEETSSEPPSDLEDRFEALLNHGNPDMLLRRMVPNTIGHLAAYSAQYLEREISQQQSEMQAQLDALFPMRDVRDFRIVRVADATIGDRGARRAGMLKVWDARAMGQDALKEGMRYMVSNLFPNRQGNWRNVANRTDGERDEIYLSTRRDTRWQMMDTL